MGELCTVQTLYFFFFLPSFVCGFAFAACKTVRKECAAAGFRQVDVNLG